MSAIKEDTANTPLPAESSRRGYRIAVTFLAVLCVVQLPLSVMALSVIASVFRQGPSMLCIIGDAMTQALYDQGYEYDQINRSGEDE